MKTLIISLLSIVLTISAFAQDFSKVKIKDSLNIAQIHTDLEILNGKWYIKNTKDTYTGFLIDYYPSGNKKSEAFIENGVYQGIRTLYYPDGKVEGQENYSYGEPVEFKFFFPNGQLMIQDLFTNGKRVGWKQWYSTGNFRLESVYLENGEIVKTETDQYLAMVRKAEHYFLKEKFKLSVKFYSRAINLLPKLDKTYLERANVYVANLKFDKAIDDYNKALELEPLNFSTLSRKALAGLQKFEQQNKKIVKSGKKVNLSQENFKILKEDLPQICEDLIRAKDHLNEDEKNKVITAIETYCL